MNLNSQAIFWIFYPFIFVGFWCLVCLLLSKIGGWGRMAKKFRMEKAPEGGSIRRMQSARIGSVNYKGCLTVRVSPAGIYLAPFPIFRIGHPPILIPFSAIRNPESKKILWAEFVKFDVGDPRITTIRMQESIFDELQKPAVE